MQQPWNRLVRVTDSLVVSIWIVPLLHLPIAPSWVRS